MSQAIKSAAAAACSLASSSSAAAATLTPVRWSYIPHQVPYALGLALQEHLVSRRAGARSYLSTLPAPSPAHSPSAREAAAQRTSVTDTLLLLQHSPVYTEGRRKGAQVAVGDDADKKRLEALGADYVVAQRGGLITYHGPGQLTGYPIIDLAAMNVSGSGGEGSVPAEVCLRGTQGRRESENGERSRRLGRGGAEGGRGVRLLQACFALRSYGSYRSAASFAIDELYFSQSYS